MAEGQGRHREARAGRHAVLPLVALVLLGFSASVFPTDPAAAQVIKPPPIVLGGRVPLANGPGTPFKPALLLYRHAEGEGFRKPDGVSVAPETGEILVADSGSNLVTLLTREGVPITSFGYNGEVPQPVKAVQDGRGRILVLAGVPRKVKVFSYRGEPLGDFAFPGFSGAAEVLPTALAVDRAGNLYVADGTSGRILIYDAQDHLVRSFGSRGQGPGAFLSVSAIAVDSAGTIYVADARHDPAIQLFDARGNYLRGWGEHSGGPQNVSLPSGIAVGPSGHIFVADTIRQTVAVFDAEGGYLFRFGGLGTRPGNLGFPSDLAADGAGRLIVAEAANTRLQVFEPTGNGWPTAGAGVSAPAVAEREREGVRQELGSLLKAMGQ